MNGDKIMTDMEKQVLRELFDEKTSNLEKLFDEKIKNVTEIATNIKENVNSFINSTTNSYSKIDTEIKAAKEKGNENELKIERLKGRIDKIVEVKRVENGVKKEGIKMWQFVIGISIPTIISIVTGIIAFINSLP